MPRLAALWFGTNNIQQGRTNDLRAVTTHNSYYELRHEAITIWRSRHLTRIKESRSEASRGLAGMTTKARARTNIIGFLAIGLVSAITMLWLFWRFPLATGITTIVVLAAFGISARLARMVDSESGAGSRAR